MTLREMTKDRVTLDVLMREAYKRFSKDGFTTQEFRALASELTGRPLNDFFAKFVDGTAPLEYEPALSRMGLRWKSHDPVKHDEGYPKKGWAGLLFERTEAFLLNMPRRARPHTRLALRRATRL